jgi:hypothetical protein
MRALSASGTARFFVHTIELGGFSVFEFPDWLSVPRRRRRGVPVRLVSTLKRIAAVVLFVDGLVRAGALANSISNLLA